MDASLGPQPGEMVPDFEFTTVDGSTTRLSELRGRHVLVDFWATWCIPCIAKLPSVKRLHDAHQSDDALTVVGMSLDKDPGAARKFLAERDLPWQQGLLGDWDSTPIPAQLGISSVPAYMLIDPDGRLVRKSNDISKLEAAIKTAIRGTPR